MRKKRCSITCCPTLLRADRNGWRSGRQSFWVVSALSNFQIHATRTDSESRTRTYQGSGVPSPVRAGTTRAVRALANRLHEEYFAAAVFPTENNKGGPSGGRALGAAASARKHPLEGTRVAHSNVGLAMYAGEARGERRVSPRAGCVQVTEALAARTHPVRGEH
jgi:hypothetical protein